MVNSQGLVPPLAGLLRCSRARRATRSAASHRSGYAASASRRLESARTCWSDGHIVNRHDIRRSRVDPGLVQDRHEHLPVFLEGLLRFPHFVDHEIAVAPEAGVVNPAGRALGSCGLDLPDYLVVLPGAQGLGMKVNTDGHESSCWVGAAVRP